VLFYDQPKLLGLTMLLAVAFPVNGIAVQFRVEINRRGEFGKLLLSDVGGQAAGLVCAIAAAVAGWGYWALGLQLTIAALVTFVAVAVRARWRPSLPRHADGLRGMLGFGANTLAVQAFNFISSNIDNVSIGRFLGATALGFYSRAWTLITLPMYQLVSPLTRVVLPALSRLEGDEFRAALRRLQVVISYGLLAVLSGVAAVAPFFLEIVLGAKWVHSAPILEMLAVGAAFQSLGYIYYWGFLSRARTGLMLLGELGGRIAMIVGILAVAHISPLAVAAASAAGAFLIWFGGTFVTGPRAGLGSIALARQAARPFTVFLAAYAVCKAARVLWLDAWQVPAVLPFAVTVAVWLAVVGASLALPAIRADLAALLAEVRSIRGRRSREPRTA
jgi:PST family polysaccharide transporter